MANTIELLLFTRITIAPWLSLVSASWGNTLQQGAAQGSRSVGVTPAMSRPHLLALLTLACASPQPAAPKVEPEKPPPADTSATGAPDADRAEGAETTALAGESAPEQADLDRLRVLEKTRVLYQQFLERADDRDEFAEATSRALERLQDMQQEMDFLKQGIAERRLRALGGNEQ